MYLSDVEYRNLMKSIARLEQSLPAVRELDALLHDRVLGCASEEERALTVAECGDGEGFLDPELFIEVASYHSQGEILRPDAHEQVSLPEYTAFLHTWLKIIDNEDHLEPLITLGAILMRKERTTVAGELKQVRDIRFKLLKRMEQLEEFV